jgi:hypothetical protein
MESSQKPLHHGRFTVNSLLQLTGKYLGLTANPHKVTGSFGRSFGKVVAGAKIGGPAA